MRNKPLNLQRKVCIIKYSIMLIMIVVNTSCEKEFEIPKVTFTFQNYFYPDEISCYDKSGNKLDSLSYMYSNSDFIYTDDYHLPYDKIEMYADNKMILYLKTDEVENTRRGIITQEKDTLYFYQHNVNPYNLLFKGVLTDNQLVIPGYGYIYYTLVSNGAINVIAATKLITLGSPDIEYIINEFPDGPYVNSEILRIQTLYFQRFDLIYKLN